MSSKLATTDVVVELSPSQAPPSLPFELRECVSSNTWENRVSALARLASQYCRPTFERAYLIVLLVLTFFVPVTTYYVMLQALEDTNDHLDAQVWYARITSFAVAVATWIFLSVPMLSWKYLGKIRVMRLADHWSREDALAASSYAAAPAWRASTSGLFRDTIVLMVTVPFTNKTNFDPDTYLPSYICTSHDALPPYGDSKMARWSKDLKDSIRYGDIPLYTDKSNMA